MPALKFGAAIRGPWFIGVGLEATSHEEDNWTHRRIIIMSSIKIRVEESKPYGFKDADAAEDFVRKLLTQNEASPPIIFEIEVYGGQTLDVGIGSPKGIFLQFIKDADGPYLVTKGTIRHGAIDYYLYGNHHTEISCEYLVGANEATKAIIHFLHTGEQLSELTWVEA